MSGTVLELPLRARAVSARFGGLVALNGVDLDVGGSQIVSIIGPNGAGKSTLLNAINGLVRITGDVSVFGRDLHSVSAHELCGVGVARTFQDPQLIDDESVIENVMGGAHHRLGYSLTDQILRPAKVRSAERESRARAMDVLHLVGLDQVAARRCKELSYGARKLIDIARALLSEPKLLLLDEPSSGLDRGERRNVEKLLILLNSTRQVSMLVVEHHMDLVRAVSHRVVALQSGSVLLSGTVAGVLDSQQFRTAMLGGGN